MADSGIRPVMEWLRRVVTQPLDELNRWQKTVRFCYDLGHRPNHAPNPRPGARPDRPSSRTDSTTPHGVFGFRKCLLRRMWLLDELVKS